MLEAVERLPDAATLHYKLAAYKAQLGEVESAKARLEHAFKLAPSLRLTALDDENLRPVWDSMGK